MPEELRPGVYRLALRGVNSYIVDERRVERTSGRNELVLVDAGTPLDAREIRSALGTLGYGPADVDRVLLTHFDIDHAGGLSRVYTDAPVHASAVDGAVLTREAAPEWDLKGVLQRVLRPVVRPPDDGITVVADGDAVGGFDVYDTPGHTHGHLAFVHPAGAVAFVGDMVMSRHGRLRPSPWFLSADAAQGRRSIREFADRIPAVEVVAPGHGDPITEAGGQHLADLAARLAERD